MRLALLAALAGAGSAPQLRVSLQVSPPIWFEGGAFSARLTIENRGTEAVTIPAAWSAGQGLIVREILPSLPGRPPAVKAEPIALRVEPTSLPASERELRIPGGATLLLPVYVPNLAPPPGDAFDVLFLSTNPPAGSETVRVERIEDLRGARAVLDTDLGTVVLALAPEAAPLAARNFVKLAEAGGYDGVTIHRVDKGRTIQTGDPETKASDPSLVPGTGGMSFDARPIPLERSPAEFDRGTVGLARIPDELYGQVRAALAQQFKADSDDALDAKLRKEWPSALALQETSRSLTSGGSQFFICTSSQPHLKGKFAAFAKVVEGLDVLDLFENLEVLGPKAPNAILAERPVKAVRIRSVKIVRPSRSAASLPTRPR